MNCFPLDNDEANDKLIIRISGDMQSRAKFDLGFNKKSILLSHLVDIRFFIQPPKGDFDDVYLDQLMMMACQSLHTSRRL